MKRNCKMQILNAVFFSGYAFYKQGASGTSGSFQWGTRYWGREQMVPNMYYFLTKKGIKSISFWYLKGLFKIPVYSEWLRHFTISQGDKNFDGAMVEGYGVSLSILSLWIRISVFMGVSVRLVFVSLLGACATLSVMIMIFKHILTMWMLYTSLTSEQETLEGL